MTPREAGRLQGFPDGFRFRGTRWDVRSQIGNAVPPPLGEAIGRAICHTLMVEDGLVEPAEDDFRAASEADLQGAVGAAPEKGAPAGQKA